MKRVVFFVVMMLLSCAGIVAASEDTLWDYDGQEGPTHWGTLEDEYFICGEDPLSNPIDYNDLITDRTDYFLYNGSLTTPPCTEGVLWIVLKQPIIASLEQIQHYHDLLGFDNNRPIQPHNSRIVVD